MGRSGGDELRERSLSDVSAYRVKSDIQYPTVESLEGLPIIGTRTYTEDIVWLILPTHSRRYEDLAAERPLGTLKPIRASESLHI